MFDYSSTKLIPLPSVLFTALIPILENADFSARGLEAEEVRELRSMVAHALPMLRQAYQEAEGVAPVAEEVL